MHRLPLCAILFLLGCGGGNGRAAANLAVPPPPSAPPPAAAPPPPRSLRLAEFISASCAYEGDKPCDLPAFDVAADGTVFAGGGHYGPVSFAGKQHPKRAYESLLLGAFARDGRGLWSVSLGTQWHNYIDELRVSGDVLFVVGIHANGFQWGRERIVDKAVAAVRSFEAETGFLAAARTDGTLLWAKSLELLATGTETLSPKTNWGSGLTYGGQKLAPDGAGGIRVLAHGASKQALLHVGGDGNVLEKRELSIADDMFSTTVRLTSDGTVHFITRAKDDAPSRLMRIDPKGGRFEAELPTPTEEPVLLAVGPKGDAYVLTPVGSVELQIGRASAVKTHHLAYYASPSDTAPRWTKSLHDPVRVQGQTAVLEQSRIKAAAYDPVSGELVLSLTFAEPLRIDGTVVPVAPRIPDSGGGQPFSATTVLRIRSDGTTSAVGQFETTCLRHHPSGQLDLFVAAGGLYLRPYIRQVADLAGCMPAEKLGGMLVRIDEQPRVRP